MTFAIYEIDDRFRFNRVLGDFADLEAAKDALVEEMEAKGFQIAEIEKDPDGHEAYDVLVCGRMIRQFAIQAQLSRG